MERAGLVGMAAGVLLIAQGCIPIPGGGGGGGGHTGKGDDGELVRTLAATPEVDSIVMLGTALLTGAGYVALRRRAHRR